jgi:Inner membrane protein YgaP-like, transmembrane domain
MKEIRNLGGLDRLARFILGLTLLTVGIVSPLAAGWNAVAIMAGAMFVCTAVAGICPGYMPFRIDTRRHRIEAR